MKTYTVKGFTGNIKEIAEHFDINYGTLYSRLKNGMSLEEAVSTPTSAIYTVNNFTGTILEIADHFDINYTTLCTRLKRGMSIEEAVNTPIKIKTYTVNNFTGTIPEIADHFKINRGTLKSRLKRSGMSLEEAISTSVKKQNHSTVYTVDGFIGTLPEIADHFRINKGTLRDRLKTGMSIEEAISTPVNEFKSKIYTVNGFTGNLNQIAKHFKINRGTLRDRLRKGMSLEEAINTPIDESKSKSKIYIINGFTGNFTQIANHFKINKETLRYRLRKGMSIEEAISIPLQKIKTKDIKYNGEIGNLKYFCKKYDKDYVEVYNKLKHLHTLKYALETTSKPYQEE